MYQNSVLVVSTRMPSLFGLQNYVLNPEEEGALSQLRGTTYLTISRLRYVIISRSWTGIGTEMDLPRTGL